jgi:DNA adenine methylase
MMGQHRRDAFDTQRIINVASVPHRSPFRYPGGKTWLVPHVRRWLRSLPNRPTQFAEPFAGGAIAGLSVLFDKLVERLTLVELDENVAAVWQVLLNGQGQRLASEIMSFPMSLKTVRSALAGEPRTLLGRAFVTILKNRVQRGGILAPGASLMKRGENGRGLASRWYPETLSRRILAIVEVRDRIRFIHGDGIEFIRQNAHRDDIAFFIDPPYTVAGRRLYTHSEIDHEELFRVASEVRGDFLMSYDNVQHVRELAGRFGLDVQAVAMKNTHHAIMSELLVGRNLDWTRRALAGHFCQDPLFEGF